MTIVIVMMNLMNDPESLSKIVENSLVGLIIVDENLRIKYVNKVVEMTTGYKKEEICGMDVFELVVPEHHEKVAKAYKKGIGGKPVFLEISYLTKNNERRWVWGYVLPMKIGNELMGVGNWIDITANKVLQSKLRESEEFHRSLIEDSIAPVAIIQNGVFAYVNKAFEEISGYKREEIIGRNPFEFFIHPEDLGTIAEKYQRLISGKSDVEFHDFRVFSKSGEDIWVRVRGTRITYKNEPAVAITGIDITEIKKSEEFHRSLIEKSLAPIHIVQNGRIVYANESFEKVTGYREDELSCMENLSLLIHPEDREDVLKKYRDIEAGEEESSDVSFRIITRSGEVRWVTVRLVRINYQGKPAVASTAMDTTEIHTLTSELERKSDYLSLLNKMLRHDILNDLTVIRAAIEVKDDGLFKTAMSRIDRISRLIYEAKNLEIAGDVRKEINLAEVVREVAESFEEANIKLNLEEVNVIANEGIKTVVFNLLNNAVKHSGKSDVEIVVETHAENGWGVLVVKDNGKGIPDEIKDKIFEEGFSSGWGTGVGLFIVKKIVELYGGSIEVKDNEPSGAVFIVRLPKKFTERCV